MSGLMGWVDRPADRARIIAQWPKMFGRPASLAESNPDWIGDGMTGDVMLYKAYYEVEVPGWKAKGAEPPYKAQPGNDCTAESTARGIDLLGMIDAADPQGDTAVAWIGPEFRACIEGIYAYGLDAANMTGDRGCYGSAIAKGLQSHGVLSYARAGKPYDVDGQRLRSWSNQPGKIVQNFREVSVAFPIEAVQITTWEAACAWWANRGVVTIASTVGFADPQRPDSPRMRNDRGIVPAFGTWPHQMVAIGVIRSDGEETAVIAQSWGPNVPKGPQPFGLPSFCFRAVRKDFDRILAQGDSWGYRGWNGFRRSPVPGRWTYDALA
jgi:hypothetical protein